jgi:hypothetical protein
MAVSRSSVPAGTGFVTSFSVYAVEAQARIGDVGAQRHTFGTLLAKGGVPLAPGGTLVRLGIPSTNRGCDFEGSTRDGPDDSADTPKHQRNADLIV